MDISGEYAHYRKFNTTTSPLSFIVPTKTAIMGMAGAILGYDRDKFADILNSNNFEVGIQLLHPIQKQMHTLNLINTKESISKYGHNDEHTQIEFEYIFNPKYRLFITCNDDILNELIVRIQNKNYHYSPYLGTAQLFANIDYIDSIDVELTKCDPTTISLCNSIVNLEKCVGDKIDFSFNPTAHYIAENMPIEMVYDKTENYETKKSKTKNKKVITIDKRITKYSEVIIELNADKIPIYINEAYESDKYGLFVTI